MSKVEQDLQPILDRLLICFVCLHSQNETKYKNNLIMLKYYLKEFEEACK